MQGFIARSALDRGTQWIAGMLAFFHHREGDRQARMRGETSRAANLVSWQPGARSRREDELLRRFDDCETGNG